MHAAEKHLKTREVKYFIAGNGITKSSEYMTEMQNNHAEGETAIIHGLSSMYLRQKHVTVYGNDSDLFALLLMHYKTIDCKELYMKSHSGYTSITAVYNFLGHMLPQLCFLYTPSLAATQQENLVGSLRNFGLANSFLKEVMLV